MSYGAGALLGAGTLSYMEPYVELEPYKDMEQYMEVEPSVIQLADQHISETGVSHGWFSEILIGGSTVSKNKLPLPHVVSDTFTVTGNQTFQQPVYLFTDSCM